MTDHRAEIIAQAQAYLEELRAAAAAIHERLNTGKLRLPQALHGEPAPQDEQPWEDEPMPEALQMRSDPIFSTREFDVPPEAVAGLVDFDN